jgi:hypothetical protein
MDNCLAPLPPTAASTSSSSTSLLTNEYETVHLINGNGNENGELDEKVTSSSSSSHVATNERIALKTASTGYMGMNRNREKSLPERTFFICFTMTTKIF